MRITDIYFSSDMPPEKEPSVNVSLEGQQRGKQMVKLSPLSDSVLVFSY